MTRSAKILFVVLAAFMMSAAVQEQRPLILVANDDGIDSPGLKALVLEMKKLGDVVVVAPKHNSSGVGHGITYRGKISFGRSELFDGVEAWWVDALPASVVAWGVDTRLGGRLPDLVVSGINSGENVGNAVYYSGTIGSAREGALIGTLAIATSMVRGSEMDLSGAAAATRRIAERLLRLDTRPMLVNINFPTGIINESTEIKVVPLTNTRWKVTYTEGKNPEDGSSYFTVSFIKPTPKPGTDEGAVAEGAISVTPLILDTADSGDFDRIEKALIELALQKSEVLR